MLLLTGCQATSSKQQAYNGVLNLTYWDFSKDGVVNLDGKWEFYWQQLVSPGDDFSKASLTGYYGFPDYWTDYSKLNLPSKGYATYRLIVRLDGKKHILSISTPDIYTEYKLWVNNELMGSNLFKEGKEPSYLTPKIYEFYSDGTQLEIVLQVKNSLHIYSGVGQSILLGSPSAIHKGQSISFALDFFLILVCFGAGLYHLVNFFLRRKGIETLYFSILCFSVGLWTMFFNETMFMRLFPALPFSVGSRIVTITIPLCIISMVLYTQALYREDISRIAVRFIVFANLSYIAILVVCRPYSYLQLFIPYLFSVSLVCMYGIYIAIKITIKKRPEYQYYIAGIIILAIGSITNILEYLKIIDIFYSLPYSLVLFVFIHFLLLWKRFMNAARNVELLSSDLKHSLNKIEDTETAFLNAQIKPHFLYNTLNTIAQCCQSDPEQAEQLILYLSKYLRGTLSFENLGNVIPLRKELELVNAYYQIEKARFDYINMQIHVDEALIDCTVPPMILQPLVENAIKHGIRNSGTGGLIKLDIKNLGTSILFTVEDNGEGIDKELLSELLTKPNNSKGIGLYNIHARLVRLYGKGLDIYSIIDKGTVIKFELPF